MTADELYGSDYDNGDASSDQPILNGRGARIVTNEICDELFHARSVRAMRRKRN
jgi:hypothetical protein